MTPMSTSTPEPSKPRLLVVDDEPKVGDMIVRLMRRHYDVTSVTSSREALELATREQWDAILCDIMMPELSGPEFLLRLSAEREEMVPRTGFMSGGTFDERTRTLLDDQHTWLSKPFGFRDVREFVARLCQASTETEAETKTEH